ncbi:hypothetical protein [Microbacterium sp. BLY]|uniref:hypothetical protein n=1 Tax=Microbacterium sp. BLY TaxID=2823280 RepID=UPI001B33F6C1|nr:hypothetical protein [Microbacterium sp. BLY]MBP3977119.1 hypothetical protein [Microbacterium sp. BLY]
METASGPAQQADIDPRAEATPEAEEADLAERRRVATNRFGWIVAWGVSVVALIVGISLTSAGTVEQATGYGDIYDIVLREVWPAGLVLLGVGALGIIATALATAVVTQRR